MNREITRIKTDVAVIGGGTAGVNVAMAAAEKGAQVLVVDKGTIERSGAIAGGIDHFTAYLNRGEAWDTKEAYLHDYVAKVAKGAADLEIQEVVYCNELKATLERMDRLKVPMRDPRTGDYYRTGALGQPGPLSININGKKLKPIMAQEVRRLGCKVLDRVLVTKLTVYNGAISGFIGFNMRTGEVFAVEAKATVISTGNTNRMFQSQNGNPYNLWYCPACTGDLHAAAIEAGVELANMEYTRRTVVPRGFSAPGFNAFFGLGSRVMNAAGEHFMHRYHPQADRAPRNVMVWACMQEDAEGRGPIFMDCDHLSKEDRQHLFTTLGYDKDTLPDFLLKKGYGEALTRIEMAVSEPMQARPSEVCGSGVRIDKTCAGNMPGIFAAGDGSDQMGCLHMAVCGGYAAGKFAASYAAGQGTNAPIADKEIKDESARIFAPLERKEGINYKELENTVRIICTNHFGMVKSESRLKLALQKLDKLDAWRDSLKAENLHELMRCHESMSIHTVAKVAATAALARKESRFKPYQYRSDFPETSEAFQGLIIISKKSDGNLTTRFHPLKY